MTQQDTFHWQDGAALYAGPIQISRPHHTNRQGFRAILEGALPDTLQALGVALIAGDGFCLTTGALPDGLTTTPSTFLTFTGGSSGTPKVIHRTQASWIASFEVNRQIFGFSRGQSVATLGHLSHSLSLYAVLEALHLGMNAQVLVDQSPKAQRNALTRHKVETLYTTPTQLRLLISGHPDGKLRHLKHILCGGGALDATTQKAAQTLCPNAAIHQFYGAAETSFITLTDAQTPQGSVGKPYQNVELHLEQGEVFVRSPYLFDSYAMGDIDDTRRADGFISVGEMGSLDADGNLWLRGRKTRMINIADQCVHPEDIERHVLAQTKVANCAVLPLPDAVRGHRLVVILEADEDLTLAAKVKDICHAAFGPLIAPRRVLFHPSLPQLPSGKADISALAHWLEAQR